MYEPRESNRASLQSMNARIMGLMQKFTPKQRRFCLEYSLDYNKEEAAKRAGYSSKGGATVTTLLKNPQVKRVLELIEERDASKFEIMREEILKHLYFLCTRTADDFCDEEGRLITDVNKLSERAKACIDGFEQVEYVDADGNTERIKTKLRLSPKSGNLEMAMKHKGLFAPQESSVKVSVDFSQLANLGQVERGDEVERRIAEVNKGFIEVEPEDVTETGEERKE